MNNDKKSYLNFIDIYSLLTGLLFGIICVSIYYIGLPLSIVPLTTIISFLMAFQAAFSLYWMMYSWETVPDNNSSTTFDENLFYTFTAIIPARHEATVIGDTIRAVSHIDYPIESTEILIVCKSDDQETISAARKAILGLNRSNISLILFDDTPINKPHALNIGLKHSQAEVVVVFDAEDQPHPSIYKIINSEMLKTHADVVQSGVQLMNFRSSWFAPLNVLEYFFWFKSTLHFFAKVGALPLGGNTVFFKREWLQKVDGWDETCLTEDADIGIRLCQAGAHIHVIYDEQYVTREEAPPNLKQFVRQRTRWNQGFIQILNKGQWLKFPHLSQKFLAGYILLLPEIQALFFLYVPVSIFMALTLKLPVIVTLISLIPFAVLFIQLVIQIVGLYEFTRSYHFKFPLYMPLLLLISFFPYQILLSISAFRAVLRTLIGQTSWEKTLHVNAHRKVQNLISQDFLFQK